jgi:adenosylcobinamide-phosphate synthase
VGAVKAAGRSAPLGAAAGLVVDRLLGDPPDRWHPVAWFGVAMAAVERRLWRDRRTAGVAHAAIGVALGAGAGLVVRSATAATAIATGGRGLAGAARRVGDALEADDLDEARRLLPWLVGRDPQALDAAGIARAVVESVAENTVDAVVAPAWWAAVGGAPAVLAHRAVNTMDAMVGHHSDRYERYGWAAARADDLAAWIPARVTALLVAAVRPQAARRIARAVARQAPAHPSPNAGVAEAAFAAALGITLGGPTPYRTGVELRPLLGGGPAPTVADIERALRLSRDATAACAALLAIAGAARGRRTRTKSEP